MSKLITGKFTSTWSEGIVVTHCKLNPNTGELFPDTANVSDLGLLEKETFEANNGETYDVCPSCHSYVLKTVVGDRADLSYGEYQECSDPDCDYAKD